MATLTEKPVLVSTTRARRLLDVGPAKFRAMVKAGKIKLVETTGRKMVVYASIEAISRG